MPPFLAVRPVFGPPALEKPFVLAAKRSGQAMDLLSLLCRNAQQGLIPHHPRPHKASAAVPYVSTGGQIPASAGRPRDLWHDAPQKLRFRPACCIRSGKNHLCPDTAHRTETPRRKSNTRLSAHIPDIFSSPVISYRSSAETTKGKAVSLSTASQSIAPAMHRKWFTSRSMCKIQRRGGGFQAFLPLCHPPGVDKGAFRMNPPTDPVVSRASPCMLHSFAKAPFRAVVGHKSRKCGWQSAETPASKPFS